MRLREEQVTARAPRHAGPFVFQAHRIGRVPPLQRGHDMVDLLVQGGDSVYLLRPTSRKGYRWLKEHTPADATWFAGALVVEHRYIRDIVAGALCEGLRVQ